MTSLLAQLDIQPRVRAFLDRTARSGNIGHAYLFVGASGAGKLDAAWALAQALLCDCGQATPPNGTDQHVPKSEVPCGACDACIRVAHHTHPDVHVYQPESASGYLVSQIRELLGDVALTPIRGRAKVYVLTHAEQLRANTANALLKTLEEPPSGVTFILTATSADVVLPTIVSRCQCVPFGLVSPTQAVASVERNTGLSRERCLMAVAITGSSTEAIAFLKSPSRQEARRVMVRALDALPNSDAADVLSLAKEVALVCDAPLAEVESTQRAMLEQNRDYLGRGALKQLEERGKRELTARRRYAIMEVFKCARVLLRDVLCSLTDTLDRSSFVAAPEVVEHLASTTTVKGVLGALDALTSAEKCLARNVNPQLTIEVLLFDIRKAFTCR